ncbi:hypothetical protein IJZ97_05495 [bacterium]|nr:hypothetical protein [bacterium]
MSLTVNRVSFTGQENNRKNVTASDVGVAAGATVGGAAYTGKAFQQFVKTSQKATKLASDTGKVGGQLGALWRKMGKNAAEFSSKIVKWGETANVAKWVKPILKSKAFKGVANALGGVGALFVFISGIGEMGQVYSELVAKKA